MFDFSPLGLTFETRTQAGRSGIRIAWVVTLPAGTTSREAFALVEVVHDSIATSLQAEGWVA